MPIPHLNERGELPPGIHAAPLKEVMERFANGSAFRVERGRLLEQVVAAATAYPSIKRILVWGSFITASRDPQDLDYSIVVGVDHVSSEVQQTHRRYLAPLEARAHYGVDRGYLVILDYPLDKYSEWLHFLTTTRQKTRRGIVEINLRGEERYP